MTTRKNHRMTPGEAATLRQAAEAIDNARGVASPEEARAWLQARRITDIECIVPDQAGVARGKMMPSDKFLAADVMSLPQSIFYQTISGDYPAIGGVEGIDPGDGDYVMRPDLSTLTLVPWEDDPTAQIIHDAYHRSGGAVEIAPRQVLRRVLQRYEARGLTPIVAPEIEFYLVRPNHDPDYPLEPPIGRSGRAEVGRMSYSISAINEFDPLVDDIYNFSEGQGLEIDTLIHEEGAAQMEINLRHGPPLELADQVFLFKRTIREAALLHDVYATFMAKPIAEQPGSAMHLHQSIMHAETGENAFADPKTGEPTDLFHAFIAGHQSYIPRLMCMLAPYVNSYRRLARYTTSPVNTKWGYDNRTVGFRVPPSEAGARRLENRVPSSDANPYLVTAASLAAGLLGIEQAMKPTPPITGYHSDSDFELPRGLLEAVKLFQETPEFEDVFGASFVDVYAKIKHEEFETFMRVISPWEREYLLLNV